MPSRAMARKFAAGIIAAGGGVTYTAGLLGAEIDPKANGQAIVNARLEEIERRILKIEAATK